MKHHKNYNALGEKETRFGIFKDNVGFVDRHNSMRNQSYKLGLNKFADLTNDEYRSLYLSGKMMKRERNNEDGFRSDRFVFEDGDHLPESIDWRDRGAVAPVKDQGQCGEFFRVGFFF